MWQIMWEQKGWRRLPSGHCLTSDLNSRSLDPSRTTSCNARAAKWPHSYLCTETNCMFHCEVQGLLKDNHTLRLSINVRRPCIPFCNNVCIFYSWCVIFFFFFSRQRLTVCFAHTVTVTCWLWMYSGGHCLISTLHSWPDWADRLWALQGYIVTMTTGGCAQMRLAGLQQ